MKPDSKILKDASENNEKWFNRLGAIIKENTYNLSGETLYKLYFDFLNLLKLQHSTSAGYTGHSEHLIFELMKNLFGEFEPEPSKKETELVYFKDRKSDLRMVCSAQVQLEGRKYKPDVSIYKGEELIAIVAVKIYQVNKNSIMNEIEKIKKLGKRALLVFFNPPSKEMRKILQNFKIQVSFFDYLILKDNEKKSYLYFKRLID